MYLQPRCSLLVFIICTTLDRKPALTSGTLYLFPELTDSFRGSVAVAASQNSETVVVVIAVEFVL